MAYEFKFDKEVATEEDRVFDTFVNKSGVYSCEIRSAELTKSKAEGSEAEYIALVLVTEDSEVLKLNIVLTNRKGEDFYIDKETGEERKLPGIYEANRLLAVSGKAKTFKGDFSILKKAKIQIAVEFKDKEGSKYADKNIKALFDTKGRTAFEITKKSEPKNIEVWKRKFADATAPDAGLNSEAQKVVATQNDDDMFPFR